jgi:hypothetical protein
MQREYDEDWDVFDELYSHYESNGHVLDPIKMSNVSEKITDHYKQSGTDIVPEETISTSVSEAEKESEPFRVKRTYARCPDCSGVIQPFQFNYEMAIFMCKNKKVKSKF